MTSIVCYFCDLYGFSSWGYINHIDTEHSDEHEVLLSEDKEDLTVVPYPDRGELRPTMYDEGYFVSCPECEDGIVRECSSGFCCDDCTAVFRNI